MREQLSTYHARVPNEGIYARLRRLQRDGRLLRRVGEMFVDAMRATVYARDEVLVYSHSAGDAVAAAADQDVSIRMLRNTADAPELFTYNLLRGTENRFGDGDAVCVALIEGGQLAHTAWVRFASEVVTTEAGPRCVVRLSKPAVIFYDCTTAAEFRGRGMYATVLRHLMDRFDAEGLDSWIYSRITNKASIRGIEKAGFRLRYRFVRQRILRWIERNRVTEIA